MASPYPPPPQKRKNRRAFSHSPKSVSGLCTHSPRNLCARTYFSPGFGSVHTVYTEKFLLCFKNIIFFQSCGGNLVSPSHGPSLTRPKFHSSRSLSLIQSIICMGRRERRKIMQAHSFRQNLASFHPRGKFRRGKRLVGLRRLLRKPSVSETYAKNLLRFQFLPFPRKHLYGFACFISAKSQKAQNDFASTIVPHI